MKEIGAASETDPAFEPDSILEPTDWRKSRESMSGGACVVVGSTALGIHVRDSQNAEGYVAVFDRTVFSEFTGRIQVGDFGELTEQ